MISFSIDYLTRNDDRKIECESDGSFAGTPSPQKDISPAHSDSDQSCCENTEAIAEVLLSLDKTIKNGLVEEQCSEKPPHSYIALISMAILSNKDRKMLLSDIYQYIMDNFQYYNNSEKAWRNSIRHNLSLNECFVKNGRSDNGKGNYWSIHPACVEDFARGDFRRRQARRRARKGLKDVNFQHGNPDISGRNCRYNFGYVPMTSSTVGYHPFAHQMYLPPSSYNCAPYPAPATPPTGFYPSTNTQQSQQTNMPSLTPCRFQGW